MTTNYEIWESEACGRCGGSGRYSYNSMDGDRCYGCGGTGLVLTKAGAAAREAWLEANTDVIPALEIREGDVILDRDVKRRVAAMRVTTAAERGLDRLGFHSAGTAFYVDMTTVTLEWPARADGIARSLTICEHGTLKRWTLRVPLPPTAEPLTDRKAEMIAFRAAAKAITAARS